MAQPKVLYIKRLRVLCSVCNIDLFNCWVLNDYRFCLASIFTLNLTSYPMLEAMAPRCHNPGEISLQTWFCVFALCLIITSACCKACFLRDEGVCVCV